MITYPEVYDVNFLKIAITAPSAGLGREDFVNHFNKVLKFHKEQGRELILGNCLYDNYAFVSASKFERAEELNRLFSEANIDLIFPPWGGELLIDLLENLNLDKFSENPTWIQGYSDISTLLFAITVTTGVATAHGTNFMDSAASDPISYHALDYLKLKRGDTWVQNQSELYQKNWVEFSKKSNFDFNLEFETCWSFLGEENKIINGRLLGGCLDVLRCLVGTSPFGDVENFCRQHAPEGLIFYFENCEQAPADVYRALYQMRYAGWFKNVNAFLIGRSGFENKEANLELNEMEVYRQVLGELGKPIIVNADIGHLPPNLTLINGALAEIRSENGSFSVSQILV